MERVCLIHTKEGLPAVVTERFPHGETRRIEGTFDLSCLGEQRYDALVFALPSAMLQQATAVCREMRETKIYVCPMGNGTKPIVLEIDAGKPRLDYLETEVSRICNLNCRSCCNFCNIVQGEKFYDFDTFCRDLSRMKELFWGVEKVRLMGGEPLLNPRLPEYVEKAREVFPDSDLRIVTNGLLIPQLSEDVLRRIRACDCTFDISNYAPTRKAMPKIAATLKKADITYALGFPMLFFFRNIREHPSDDPAPAFRNCIFTHCHMLAAGRLAPCSYACCIPIFNAHFGTDFPEDDYLSLDDPTLDGWKIIEAFEKPHKFCACCGSGVMPLPWKGHVSRTQAKPADWLITDSFLHMKVAPMVQHSLKPIAVRLRKLIQRKKV